MVSSQTIHTYEPGILGVVIFESLFERYEILNVANIPQIEAFWDFGTLPNPFLYILDIYSIMQFRMVLQLIVLKLAPRFSASFRFVSSNQ